MSCPPRNPSKLIIALLIFLCNYSNQVTAETISVAQAEFTPLQEVHKFGAWEQGLYRYENTGRHLCMAQTSARDGTTIRVNFYIYENESFLEIFNPKWVLRKGPIYVDFLRSDKLGLRILGDSEGHAIVFDLVAESQFRTLLGFMVGKAVSFVLNVPHKGQLTEISLNGAKQALERLFLCFDPLNPGAPR